MQDMQCPCGMKGLQVSSGKIRGRDAVEIVIDKKRPVVVRFSDNSEERLPFAADVAEVLDALYQAREGELTPPALY